MKKAILCTLLISLIVSFSAPLITSAAPIPPRNLLVVLVQFNNASIQYSDLDWSNKFFGTTGSTVKNYFKEISNNQFYFVPAAETYGTSNDGVIKVVLPYNHSRDIMTIPADAITAADQFINFASYDSNQDGMISSEELTVAFIYAGFDKSTSTSDQLPSVYPVSTCIDAQQVTLDGKSVLNRDHVKYTVQGEVSGNTITRLGVIVHELGHTMTIPDLYAGNLNGVTSYGPGIYSLMATGCWGTAVNGLKNESPTHFDPFYKIKFGFFTPTTVNSPGTYTLYNSTSLQYNILKIPTSNPKQYFLIENRQLTGFDAGLFRNCDNGGILIWHIDESKYDNENVNDKMTDIEEANEGDLGYSQIDTMADGRYNHFYYVGGHTVFNGTTMPNSNLKNGNLTGLNVEVLSTPGSAMNVRIDYCLDPQNLKATLSGNNVTLDWDAVAGAVSYEVDIDGITTTTTSNSFTYTLNNINNGIHQYKVRASTGTTFSSWSKTVTTRHLIIGDINQDNEVNSLDMATFNAYLLQINGLSNLQKLAADVDGSGDVNALDLAVFRQYLMGISNTYPIGSLKHIIYGDLTGNGLVDSSDVSTIFYYLYQQANLTTEQLVAGNVTGYNDVDATDFNMLMNYVNGDGNIDSMPGGN